MFFRLDRYCMQWLLKNNYAKKYFAQYLLVVLCVINRYYFPASFFTVAMECNGYLYIYIFFLTWMCQKCMGSFWKCVQYREFYHDNYLAIFTSRISTCIDAVFFRLIEQLETRENISYFSTHCPFSSISSVLLIWTL